MTSLTKNSKSKSTQSLTVFLDSSVILSGLASPSGGSRKILDAGRRKKLRLVAIPFVVQEVANNLSKLQVGQEDMKDLITTKTLLLVPDPPKSSVWRFRQVTPDPNDAPILAGAVFSGATALVTLDKTHIFTQKVKSALKPMKIFSPKDFWNWVER